MHRIYRHGSQFKEKQLDVIPWKPRTRLTLSYVSVHLVRGSKLTRKSLYFIKSEVSLQCSQDTFLLIPLRVQHVSCIWSSLNYAMWLGYVLDDARCWFPPGALLHLPPNPPNLAMGTRDPQIITDPYPTRSSPVTATYCPHSELIQQFNQKRLFTLM